MGIIPVLSGISLPLQDFLLTYRLFLKSPMEIADKLIKWFLDEPLRERITRVVLLWVNNHFNDFESDMEMTEFLQSFEATLEQYVRLPNFSSTTLYDLLYC